MSLSSESSFDGVFRSPESDVLDVERIVLESSRSGMSARQRRAYGCFRSGLEYALSHSESVYSMVLTGLSGDSFSFLRGCLQALRKSILRHWGVEIDYSRIACLNHPSSENQFSPKPHFHLLFKYRGLRGGHSIPVEWLEDEWCRLTSGAWKVYIHRVGSSEADTKRVCRYMAGYLSDSHHVYSRLSYSRSWIFEGWRRFYRSEFFGYGSVSDRVLYWNHFLRSIPDGFYSESIVSFLPDG